MVVNGVPARAIGATRSGLGAWLLQRLTSIYAAGFVIYAALHWWMMAPVRDHAQWAAVFSGPVRVAAGLFFASILVHAWIGLRDIYRDYLHAGWLRLGVSAVTAGLLVAQGLWIAAVMLRGVGS